MTVEMTKSEIDALANREAISVMANLREGQGLRRGLSI